MMTHEADRAVERGDAELHVAASEQHRRIARGRAAIFERVVSSLTHALGTPLQVIAGRAAMIRMDAVDDEVREHARIIEKKVHDMTQLLQRVLDFVRGHDFDPAEGDWRAAMKEAFAAIEPLAKERSVKLELDAEVPASCAASPDTLFLLSADLLADAVDWSSAGGTVKVSMRSRQPAPPSLAGAEQEGVMTRVELTGSSLDPGRFERAHEPWLKSDTVDRDAALRRAVVLGVLRRVGGCLDARDGSGGSTLGVWVPSVVSR